MNSLWKDTRYAMRTLMKRPGFALIALLTLALGIGANTAIFSIVNGVLLRPLPFSEPDRLVWVWGRILNAGQRASVSPPDYLDYRELNKSFEQFAASMNVPYNLTSGGEPERLLGARVTGNYFQAFGVNAALGRTFSLDNEQSGQDQVVVLSDGLWKRRFGADPSIVTKTITLDGKSYQVLGVLPSSFRFPQSAELWAPLNFGAFPEMKIRKAHFLRPVGRLREGVSLAQAQSEMDAIAGRLAEQYPDSNTGWSLGLVSLREQINGVVKQTLLVLLGVVVFVLLIACANVANLLLVRAASRQKEMALRAALGASRWRLVRQMLIESLLLSLIGGVLGTLFAIWGVDLLVTFSDRYLPSTTQVSIDSTVLGFTLALSLLAGVVFGAVPALNASRINFNQMLKEGGRSGSEGPQRNRTRSLLTVLESALALILLVGAGLMIRSFLQLQNVNPGFDPSNVLTVRIDLPRTKYDTPEKAGTFFEELRSRIAELPGVEAVGSVTELPMSGQLNDVPFTIEGRPPVRANERFGADFRRISGDYFRAMRIPLLKGRLFNEQEVRQSSKVVVISESLASTCFPNEESLSKHLVLDIGKDAYEIVGVVGDVRHRGLGSNPFAMMYLPTQAAGGTNVVVRTSVAPTSLAAGVRQAVKAIDRDQPVSALRPMEQWVSESTALSRYRTTLLGLFAAVALALAVIGIYGVTSYSVEQRTHELGVRIALGARQADVLRLVVVQGMKLVLGGIGIGLVGAFMLTRVMSGFLFGVRPTDPLTFGLVAAMLVMVALVACYVPARRATKVDPMVALRYE